MKLNFTRFNIAQRIVDEKGQPTAAFLRWINDTIASIVASVNDTAQLVTDVALSLQRAGIAITTANEAKAAQLAAARETALTTSYVTPAAVLASAIDANDATRAVITVAAHSRVYGDGTSVAVTGSTITGLALSTGYFITYMDADHAGGSVTYTANIDYALSGQGNARHLVGTIMTPGSGATDPTDGDPTLPPGVPWWKIPPREDAA